MDILRLARTGGLTMRELIPAAERAASLLRQRGETVAVAESSAGGLITAALLAVPGASEYCIGGSVVYTRAALLALRDMDDFPVAAAETCAPVHDLFHADFESFGGHGLTGIFRTCWVWGQWFKLGTSLLSNEK